MNVNVDSRRIRVLQLGNPTGLYGAERWILALVRHLDPTEVESIVAVIRDDPALAAPLAQVADGCGIRTQVFEAHGRGNWSAVGQVRNFVLANDVQVLHTHGYKTDLIGLLATLRTPCRLISTPHGWSVQAGFKLKLYEATDRAIFPFFDAVAPLSATMLAELGRLPGVRSKLKLIRNGVDVSEIDAGGAIAGELAAWKAQGCFVVGYIGQLIPRKGLAVLLQAFAQLPVAKKKLAIVGDGPQEAELRALAAALGIGADVAFLGFRPDRLEWLRGFDVFVLPSRLEGIPRCLMEAMAARIPVVASDIPGCRDLIEHGRTGLMFRLDDVAALGGMLEVCCDPELRARMGRAGRDLILAQYSAASMARQYRDLYRGVLAGSVGSVHATESR
jgi:glycosyltransferase involved in cell wall biosynthesis